MCLYQPSNKYAFLEKWGKTYRTCIIGWFSYDSDVEKLSFVYLIVYFCYIVLKWGPISRKTNLFFSAYFSFLSEYSDFLLFQESKVKFHVVGLKCAECGSYNTSREGEEGVPVMPPPIPVAAVATEAAEGEDEWETEEEEEIVGGDAEQENEEQGQDDGVNLAEVQLDMDGDSNNVLPLD